MNPNNIPDAGWTFYLIDIINWLNPLILGVGLIIAVWAFRRCRKCGYLLFSFYFALALFSMYAMPPINRAIRAHRAPDVSEQVQLKTDAAVKQAVDKTLAEEGHPVVSSKRTVRFPFGSILSVFGLWLLAKGETPHPNCQPEPPAAGNMKRL